MGKQVNLYQAKSQLSRLVDEAAQGEEIVIAKNGKPLARLVTVDGQQTGRREFGQWAELITPEERAEHHSAQWRRNWNEADARIERDFARALGSGVAEEKPGWPATSSTRTRSSGSKRSRNKSKRKRSRN